MSWKKQEFVWTEEHDVAFMKLKEMLTPPPVLAFPRFDYLFIVETNASSRAFGTVLTQKQESGKIKPVYYTSRKLSQPRRTTERAGGRLWR